MQKRSSVLRSFVSTVAVTSLFLASVPCRADEDGPAPVAQADEGGSARVAQTREVVRQRLLDVGLDAHEADVRLAQLTDVDLQKLADNPQQVAMGGVKDKTLIIIAVVLVLPSIILLALYL